MQAIPLGTVFSNLVIEPLVQQWLNSKIDYSACVVMSNSFVTPWTAAHQTPLSMGLPRQEYQSGLPLPPLGDLPHQGLNPHVLCLLRW